MVFHAAFADLYACVGAWNRLGVCRKLVRSKRDQGPRLPSFSHPNNAINKGVDKNRITVCALSNRDFLPETKENQGFPDHFHWKAA
jgi:hypothetical protein